MKKVQILLAVLCSMLLTGCTFNSQAVSPGSNGSTSLPLTEIRDIAYQFRTDLGQIITIRDNPDIEAVYTTPTATIDAICTRMPVQITIGDFIVEIGFVSPDKAQNANVNIYQNLYKEVVNKMLTAKDGGTLTEQLREKLSAYTVVYPTEITESCIEFTGKDLPKKTSSVWSASPVDYSGYGDFDKFNLPVATVTQKLKTGEVLVCHCLATTDSGYWKLEEIPTLVDLLSEENVSLSSKDYSEQINTMKQGYSSAAQILTNILPDIQIGDYSEDYVVLSLDSDKLILSNYGVNTDYYDNYAFIRLQDNSIYIVYEKNGVHGADCVAGDRNHMLSTDWDTYDTKTVDQTDNVEYKFTWNRE